MQEIDPCFLRVLVGKDWLGQERRHSKHLIASGRDSNLIQL